MRTALEHRGPDGSGVEIVANVGLVHTRLAIVDTSENARQPMAHPGGDLWISFNGEIFNHQALRREMPDEHFSSSGDTATLLHAFGRRGTEVLADLNGQFAFAVLDLGQRRLTLVRDRFGIKPLYIAHADGGIWFASEPEALLAAGISDALVEGSFRSMLDASCHRGQRTVFERVTRVLPGTSVEISTETLEMAVHRWGSTAAHVNAATQQHLQSLSRRSLTRLLETTLRSSVHDALLGDVPIGVLCSGGVDSSLVTALAVEVQPDIVAFGARYRDIPSLDEGKAEIKVAQHLGVELDILEITRSGWRAGLLDAALHFGAPLPNGSSVTVSQLAVRARQRGIKVLLTGEGADELFAGYKVSWHRPFRDFLSPSQQAARLLERWLLVPPTHTARTALEGLSRMMTKQPGTWAQALSLLTANAEHPVDDTTALAVDEAYRHHSGARQDCETALLRDFDALLCFLLIRMDKNMMEQSVEARVPFLDPRLVELALNLPLEARTTPWSKGILRDVAKQFLPWDIAHRRKIYGMMFDAAAWIEEAASFSFLTNGMLRDVFRIGSQDFQQLLTVSKGYPRFRLWSGEIWCRTVLGGQSKETIEKELWQQEP